MNKRKLKAKTTILFSKIGSYRMGVASVFDLSGSMDNIIYSESPTYADSKAIASDWYVTGHDLEEAIEKSSEELTEIA